MARPPILVTAMLPDAGMALLHEYCTVTGPENGRHLSREELIGKIKNKAGLICLLSDCIDKELLDRASSMQVIANYAVGYNNIDIEEASKHGIAVTNTPGVLTDSTADLTMTLILGIARRIVEADAFLRAGSFTGWSPRLMLGSDVYKKTLGIIGFGRIGQAVAQRAKGFGMHILYHEPVPKDHVIERKYEAIFCDLPTLLSEADFVSLHVPLNKDTIHMISDHEFSYMKPGAFLINVARGPVVDEKALIRALRNETISGCALDVYEHEPHVAQELVSMKNTILVPHIGSATMETRVCMAIMTAESVISVVIKGERPEHIVNPGIYKT